MSRGDPAQLITQVSKEESSLNTEQQLQSHTESAGFCACLCNLFSCCSNGSTNGKENNGVKY